MVAVEAGRIVEIGSQPRGRVIDLGNCCLTSSLCNTHCHLDLSDFRQPIPYAGSFTDWVAAVIAHRAEHAAGNRSGGDAAAQAVAAGIAESTAAGVGLLVDIAAGYRPGRYPQRCPLELVPLAELISITPQRRDQTQESAVRLLAGVDRFAAAGLSPHAPYTTDPSLLHEALRWSSKRRLPLAMHLAETAAEVDWLEGRGGALASMRSRFMQDEAADRFASCEQILELLSASHRGLIIHGNYLTDGQLDIIAASRERLAVVYCPRTAAAFGHPPHPIERCIDRGIRVFFGTDSRASNPDLRLLEDLKAVRATHPRLDPQTVWDAATLGPRAFLGLPRDRGTLSIGSRGPLALIRSDEVPSGDGDALVDSFFAPSATATLFDLSAVAELA